ncbi:MAG: tetratricopeptide repeat protein [Phycisphaerae bacterium]|nr:tetratricopeptide repeat protein [Phycisphaerae bacterium]
MDPNLIKPVKAALDAGRTDEAERLARTLLDQNPDDPIALNTLGGVLAIANKYTDAVEFSRRAAKAAPDNRTYLKTLLTVLTHAGLRMEALEVMERLLQHTNPKSPEHAGLCLSYATLLYNLVRFDDSKLAFETALQVHPNDYGLHLGFAQMMNYLPGATPEQVFERHKALGDLIAPLAPTNPPRFGNTLDPEKKLKVAIVSPDLRGHSVVYYLEPVLEHADKSKYQYICYSTAMPQDTITERLKSYVSSWRRIPEGTAADLAAKMWTDAPDIIVDIAAHTNPPVLHLLNLRAAPLQMTWLGYPNTTGVKNCDVRLIDSITDPPGAERLATEKLVRLDPCFLCIRPSPEVGPIMPAPSASGPFVFGTFNNMAKFNDRVAALWSRVLNAVPGSMFVMKNAALNEPAFREVIVRMFAAHGIARERMEFLPRTQSVADHLNLYRKVDVALDPFPYNGTTTISEAAWMGVPTICLEGDSHVSRVGVSLNAGMNLHDFNAKTEDEYVQVAVKWASDLPKLHELRRTMRERILASPHGDAPGFARRFEAALRNEWRLYCSKHK